MFRKKEVKVSKASEYTKAVLLLKEIKPPTFPQNSLPVIQARVWDDGRLRVDATYFTPEEAIELARWIIHTFEEE